MIRAARLAFPAPGGNQAARAGGALLPAGTGALRPWVFAEPVTGRQPQGQAGQVMRVGSAAQLAPPHPQYTRPDGRGRRAAPRRPGARNPVRGGLPGHGDDLLPGCERPEKSGCSREGPGKIWPSPCFARKMVLQVAAGDIGQLTDFARWRRRAPASSGAAGHADRFNLQKPRAR